MLRTMMFALAFAGPMFAARAAQDIEVAQDELSLEDVVQHVREVGQKTHSQESLNKAAAEALEQHKDALSRGDGVHWRGQLLILTGDYEGAYSAFREHAAAAEKTELGQESLVNALYLADATKSGAADVDGILARIDETLLSDQAKRGLASFKQGYEVDRKRNALVGKPAPAFTALHVVNGQDGLSLADLRGKVVVLDFFATWCPPCREVVPEMVKLQDELGPKGVQVLGVTRYYGFGMDFSDPDAELPHGGKSVGGRSADKKLSQEDEIKINETFVGAFKVNYPLVFTEDTVGKDDYAVSGIPTVFVLDREGKVMGSAVGSGEANHEKVIEMIHKALGAGGAGGDSH